MGFNQSNMPLRSVFSLGFSIAIDVILGLLIILSQGSDPLSMNDHYEKVFDAISTVHHNKNDKQASAPTPHTSQSVG